MWNDGPSFDHFLTDPFAPHPVVNPKTVCFKGGGGGGNDQTFYQNIKRDEDAARKAQQDALDRQFELQSAEAAKAKAAEEARQAGITQRANDVGAGFDSLFTPDFYQRRQSEYTGFLKPQLDDQFTQTQKKLTYWLADRGLLDSSVRGDKTSELQKTYDTANRDISNRAVDWTNQLKDRVAQSRASLIADVRNSSDPSATATQALSTASDLRGGASAPFSTATAGSLGDIFGAFTGTLAQQAALERASAYSNGAVKPLFNTGLFAPTNSVSVIR